LIRRSTRWNLGTIAGSVAQGTVRAAAHPDPLGLTHGYVTMLPSFAIPEIVLGVAMFMVVSFVLQFIPLGTWA
jgi:hypothetical protein